MRVQAYLPFGNYGRSGPFQEEKAHLSTPNRHQHPDQLRAWETMLSKIRSHEGREELIVSLFGLIGMSMGKGILREKEQLRKDLDNEDDSS